MRKRSAAMLLVALMSASALAGCAGKKSGPAPPPTRNVASTTVTIHYHRYQGDYSAWDLWVWPNGQPGKAYELTETDGFGVKATIIYTGKVDKVGFIVRKGGESWAAKDTAKDRFIDITAGTAEIWVVEGEEAFATSPDAIDTKPKVRAAYLDTRRTVIATLSHGLELKGTPTEGFTLKPAVRIESVRDNQGGGLSRKGYEFLSDKEIRFLLVPGQLGAPQSAADGKAEIYVSGPFNGWGGTMNGSFKPLPQWRMKWSPAERWYELIVPVGEGPGHVPGSGIEFKFTQQVGSGQQWYPGANLPIVRESGTGTKEVIITLAVDADLTRDYRLEHETLGSVQVKKRGVLDDPAFIYKGNDLGHTYAPAGTHFRLWAPTAIAADVLLYDQPEGGSAREFTLSLDTGGTWAGSVPGDQKGKYYTYRLTMGATKVEIMDPYAVGAGVNGDRALVVNLKETNPPGWESHKRPPMKNPTDAIIYEVHVRDLSTFAESGIKNKGKFLGFTETGTRGPGGVKTGLDHITELGITHVHLLPAFDYATVDERRTDQFNWGYDPKNFNVPEGSYATNPNGPTRIREFKQMVKALHDAGLRVIMDVVYNHTYVGASPFEAIAPFYYYRFDASGRFSNGSGTGNETASERPMMRKYILDSVKYWASEYMVDGFRFDLMGLHDIETMRQVRQTLDAIDPSILVYGEPWTGGASPLDAALRMHKGAQKGMRVAVFNDHFRDAVKGDTRGLTRGFATGAGLQQDNVRRGVSGAITFDQWIADFAQHPHEAINYVSAHDDLTLWDKIANTNRDDSEEIRIRMDALAQGIVFTSQGVAFLHAGEEMLRTKDMIPDSYKSPDAVNQLNWARKAKYPAVFEYYKGLVDLRKAHPAFRLLTGDEVRLHLRFTDSPPGTVSFLLTGNAGGDSWRNIMVVYNPQREEKEITLPEGTWSIAVQGMEMGAGLGAASGKTQVPGIAMMVLYQP